jgi:deoxyribonuclease-4
VNKGLPRLLREPISIGALMRLGFHVSIAGSLDKAVDRAKDLGCSTFQIFTRNPRGWAFSTLDAAISSDFRNKLASSGISPVLDHMPYLPNLSSANGEVYGKSVETLKAELGRCDSLGIPYLVTHLGSHLGAGPEEGRRRLVNAIASALMDTNARCVILLENTAGTKNSIGTTFAELAQIMGLVGFRDRIGFCFDTCHAMAGGYDLKGKGTKVLDELEEVIGLDRLKAIHLNDSKGVSGSHLDRHEHIGMGTIGEEGFRVLLRDDRLKAVPMIMETPIDARRDDRGNLSKVLELAGINPSA